MKTGNPRKDNSSEGARTELRGAFACGAANSEMSRRSALKMLMGASAALAFGVTGCERKPRRKIISRVSSPEFSQPAKVLYYSSTWSEGPFPYGLLIRTVDGRPIKIEGNPDHPVNAGSSSSAMQATLLSLYDPDRLRGPMARGGKAIDWKSADARIVEALRGAKRVVIITRSTLGPSERALMARFLTLCPAATRYVHESIHDGPRRAAWAAVYGQDGELIPRFDKARVIVGFDCDFLGDDGVVLENIRRFADSRSIDRPEGVSRFYAFDSAMTVTGANADHRIPLRPGAAWTMALGLRESLAMGKAGQALTDLAHAHKIDPRVLDCLIQDLKENKGSALAVAGAHLPAGVHAGVALLNEALGAREDLLEWNPQPAALPVSNPAEIEAAFGEDPDVAILLGVNPLYDWPGGGFAALLNGAKLSIGHSLYPDETLGDCDVALASCHNLESWNDANPRPGVDSLCQPVIAPLFDCRQEAESLLRWTQALAPANDPIHQAKDFHDFIRRRWIGPLAPPVQDGLPLAEERGWERRLAAGGRFDPTSPERPRFNEPAAQTLISKPPASGDFDLVILPHHAIHDGRFANNPWLQELPHPIARHVWDGVAMMSPATAKGLGIEEGDAVSLAAGNRTLGGASSGVPALIVPGVAGGVVAVTTGHGRVLGGEVLKDAGGTNVAPLLGAENRSAPRLALHPRITKAAGAAKLARIQTEFSLHDRPIVFEGTAQEYLRDTGIIRRQRHLPEKADQYAPYDYSESHKWAMAVDLSRCVGCGACVAACQAENNVAVVGRKQVGKGRVMHWLRVDCYLSGPPENPNVHFQTMFCQHCDHAPCETVCPVNATTHSAEGLNEQTYNRCVGTRYCSNNCPYKVRRFNYLHYQEIYLRDPVQELAFNPQVTVRGVGVMEKCTFCLQRILDAKRQALNEGKELEDGAIQTACQQACPAKAIVFGDANIKGGRLAQLRKNPRAYYVLEELNVKPNVTYLARLRNPHPVAGERPASGGRA